MNWLKGCLPLVLVLNFNTVFAATHSMASLTLGYGSWDIGAGDGKITVTTDANNQLKSITIEATVGMLGMSSHEVISQDVSSLIQGNSLSFYMQGASQPILKISAASGFSKSRGGVLNLKVLKAGGYSSQNLEIALGAQTNQFYLWKDSVKVKSMHINTRGYSFSGMVVGWYSITTY